MKIPETEKKTDVSKKEENLNVDNFDSKNNLEIKKIKEKEEISIIGTNTKLEGNNIKEINVKEDKKMKVESKTENKVTECTSEIGHRSAYLDENNNVIDSTTTDSNLKNENQSSDFGSMKNNTATDSKVKTESQSSGIGSMETNIGSNITTDSNLKTESQSCDIGSMETNIGSNITTDSNLKTESQSCEMKHGVEQVDSNKESNAKPKIFSPFLQKKEKDSESDNVVIEEKQNQHDAVTQQEEEEEGFKYIFKSDCRLYRLDTEDNSVKSRGVGIIYISLVEDVDLLRIIMVRHATKLLACNHYISPSFEIEKHSIQNNVLIWSTLIDSVDKFSNLSAKQVFLVKFKEIATVNEFYEKYKEAQKYNQNSLLEKQRKK